MMLPEGKGQLVTYGYSQADFVFDVLARVPEVQKLAPYPYGAEEGVHSVLSDLARLIRQATEKQNSHVLERAFGLVNEAIERDDADPEIENAAYISFLEPHDAPVLREWDVWRLASPKLKSFIKQEV